MLPVRELPSSIGVGSEGSDTAEHEVVPYRRSVVCERRFSEEKHETRL